MDDMMGTAEAAQRLGVSLQRVRALWHEGAVTGRLMANRLLLDRSSVFELAERERPATRPLSARNAWGMLVLLADEVSPRASPSEVSRLRTLAFTRDADALAVLVRARARTVRYDGVEGAGEYVLRDRRVVASGATLAHRWTDLIVDGLTEVYGTASDVQGLAGQLRLWREPQGPIIMHAVADDLGDFLRDRTEMPDTVVAVDLLESNDPRGCRAGETLWRQVLRRWRNTAVPLRTPREIDPR